MVLTLDVPTPHCGPLLHTIPGLSTAPLCPSLTFTFMSQQNAPSSRKPSQAPVIAVPHCRVDVGSFVQQGPELTGLCLSGTHHRT